MKKTLPLPARVRRLVPYASARSLYKGDNWTLLDANESPFAPVIDWSTKPLCNRYPDPTSDLLRDAIGKTYRLSRDQVMMASGSDEIIDLIVRCFVRRGRSVAALEPSYGMYKVSCLTNGIRYVPLELDRNYQLPNDVMKNCRTSDVLMMCNPNNPTGSFINQSTIARVCTSFPGIVVVDEAYGEFSDALGHVSSVGLVRKGVSNLIVLRTFSKAFGAAGIRLGYALSDASIINVLLRCKLPYNVSVLTQNAGVGLWKNRKQMQRSVKFILKERTRLMRRCSELGLSVHKSVTNFFLVEFSSPQSAEKVFQDILKAGVIVRRLYAPRLRSMLRLTVGTRKENDKLVSILTSIL